MARNMRYSEILRIVRMNTPSYSRKLRGKQHLRGGIQRTEGRDLFQSILILLADPGPAILAKGILDLGIRKVEKVVN